MKTCPECGSNEVFMFDSDNDACRSCNKWFPAVSDVDVKPDVIDRKFIFTAVNPCNGKHYSQDNAIVFCAKDKAVPAMLRAYKGECRLLGCTEEHLESIGLLIDRVEIFQKIKESKIPDTSMECEIDRCIGGNI